MEKDVFEIEDFISAVMTGIVKGSVKANKEIVGLGGRINPSVRLNDSIAVGSERDDLICRAEFDIALTVADEKGGNVKVGVLGGFFGGSAGTNTEVRSQSVSRVKFSIPYSLPQSVEVKSSGCAAVTLNRGERDFSGL